MNYASILNLSDMYPAHEYRELGDRPQPEPDNDFPNFFFLSGIIILPAIILFGGIFILNRLS